MPHIYGVHKEVKDLFNSFRLFGRSPRLKNLIFFGALISAVILSLTMLRSSIMQDIGIPSEYFGIIFAVLGLISGIAAKNEFRVHKKFRNKTLASLALPLVFSCIILGVVCQVSSNFVLNVSIVLIMFLIQYIVRGPFYPLIKQYLNNFTTVSLRNKISSSFNLLENILRFAITFIASALLRITTTANTYAWQHENKSRPQTRPILRTRQKYLGVEVDLQDRFFRFRDRYRIKMLGRWGHSLVCPFCPSSWTFRSVPNVQVLRKHYRNITI